MIFECSSEKMTSKRTTFNPIWMDATLNPIFASWLVPVKNSPYEAWCKQCNVSINLSNMGRQALCSYMSGAKHVRIMSGFEQSQSILKSFVKKLSPLDIGNHASNSSSGSQADVASSSAGDRGTPISACTTSTTLTCNEDGIANKDCEPNSRPTV